MKRTEDIVSLFQREVVKKGKKHNLFELKVCTYNGPCSMYYVGLFMLNLDLIENLVCLSDHIDLFLCDMGN